MIKEVLLIGGSYLLFNKSGNKIAKKSFTVLKKAGNLALSALPEKYSNLFKIKGGESHEDV